MTTEEAINALILGKDVDSNRISDGYHEFGELYEHRITLFIALCRVLDGLAPYCGLKDFSVWKSLKHSDGTGISGWFILGIGKEKGGQITYHVPISKWDECAFEALDQAPPWDGHSSADVLKRLKQI